MFEMSATEKLVRPNRVLFNPEQEAEIFTEWRSLPDSHRKRRIHEKIIQNYFPIVYKVARAMDGYTNSGSGRIERDDLIGEGMAGLTDAANRFDLSLGWRFSTYAQSWIRGVVYAYIARNYFIVNPCSNGTRKKMFFRLRTMIYKDRRSLGSFEISPEMAQLFADSFQTTPDEVFGMLSMFRAPQESLSEPVKPNSNMNHSEGVSSRQDMLVDPRNAHAELEQAQQDRFRKEVIALAVQKLRPRERRIYMTQMVRETDEIMTLQDLGAEFGISKERVRQLRDKASAKVARTIHAMVGRGEVTRTDLFG